MDIKRNTVQRQIILDTLKKFHTHPTVDKIYAEIQKAHPTISKTTVYRNLRQLAQNGIIRQISILDGFERYDGIIDRHHHFRCKSCGDILDVDIPYLADIDEIVRQKYDLQIDGHDIVFKGICSKCGDNRK